jgi:hypothetical protein
MFEQLNDDQSLNKDSTPWRYTDRIMLQQGCCLAGTSNSVLF